MEWAHKQGYQYYDKSIVLARPQDKVMQWKRSYRGLLNLMGNYTYFYIRLPKNSCRFLWQSPLFGKENNQVTLHIGLPVGESDESIMAYLSAFGFGGLSTLYLHTEGSVSAKILKYIDGLYTHYEAKPTIKILLNG